MTRVLFTSMPMAGHLRPGLPIAAQLVADGHEVAWYTGANYAHLPEENRPPFLDYVLDAPPSRIRYEAIHSEEGGRFLSVRARYLAVEADETVDPPPGYAWATPAQLTTLTRHGHYVNVEARTLLACIYAATVQPHRDA